ncbi:Hydrogenase-4 component B [Candidatus Nitrosocosmicus oleophilus]|uniref:Hydrogenase-4 component B n=2 Tax=Candidatus Nitrosocosmicus oleophilus TaxID=1353260 RepID=A0A654MEC5_9ARCH|nr:Hydrogenase-4 component B [Candidatus Nitrosocosmicus oleophilus]
MGMVNSLIKMTPETSLIMSIILTPILGGILVTIFKKKRLIEIISVLSTSIIFFLTFFLFLYIVDFKKITLFNEFFYIDSLSMIVLLLISFVSLVSSIYSVNYMGKQYQDGLVDDKHLIRYYQGFNIFIFTMLLVPILNNTGLIWVAVEATTLISVLLIMIYVKEDAIRSAWKYLIIATVGLSFALIGTVFFYYANIHDPFVSVQPEEDKVNWTNMLENSKTLDPMIVKIAFIFIIIGYGTKAGIAPMHTWLPDAHSESPTPISAMLSGVLLNCALYGILRFYLISSGAIGAEFSDNLLIIFGLLSVGIATFSILFQKDMKRMLAYSSVEHIGIVTLAFGFGGLVGIYGALLHMINHAIVKPLMFFASGKINQKYKTKAMFKIKGIVTIMPITGIMFLIGGLAIVGLPPFNIFLSKFMILSSGFSSNNMVASTVLIILLAIIFIGFIKNLVTMSFGKPKTQINSGELDNLSIVSMGMLVFFVIMLGIYIPEPLNILINDAVHIFNQV